jgi:sec-independent protein translocase protein TatA
MFGIGQTELIIVMVIAILLFGSSKLPTLMRNLGRSAKEFKQGMKDVVEDSPEDSKKQDPMA